MKKPTKKRSRRPGTIEKSPLGDAVGAPLAQPSQDDALSPAAVERVQEQPPSPRGAARLGEAPVHPQPQPREHHRTYEWSYGKLMLRVRIDYAPNTDRPETDDYRAEIFLVRNAFRGEPSITETAAVRGNIDWTKPELAVQIATAASLCLLLRVVETRLQTDEENNRARWGY